MMYGVRLVIVRRTNSYYTYRPKAYSILRSNDRLSQKTVWKIDFHSNASFTQYVAPDNT